MKYMLSCRQDLIQLKKADEIKVNYKDINRINDFINPDNQIAADIIIYLSKKEETDWDKINKYKDLLNIIIATEDGFQIPDIKKRGYQCFWSYPVTTYWELQGLLQLGVNQVLLDAPLYFDLKNVKRICKTYNTKIRLIANKCFNNYMPRVNGIKGTYIRPEDVEYYEKFVDSIEFDTDSLEKERTLWHIYAENHYWPGNLNLLLDYLNINIDNRGIDALPNEENLSNYFARRRSTCGQVCQSAGRKCNFCQNIFDLVNTIDKENDWLQEQFKE